MATGPESSALRVVVADDDYLVREGARSVLSSVPGVNVVATVGDAEALMTMLAEARPDAVVLDIRMPPTYQTEGIEAAHRIRRESPGIGVVILSNHADPEYALEVLRYGSAGLAYLLKERLGDPAQLAEAIREVTQGRSVLDPKVVDALLEAQRRRSMSRLHGLSQREGEVLELMGRGRNNAAIAAKLGISERSVEEHINSVFKKLGLSEELDVNHRVAAVLYFLGRSAD